MLYAFERDAGRPFISMELVPGESLRTRIRRGTIPLAEALAVARDVAGALATAHRRGIVHRDIKPENLMFDEDGRVKVMDFGLARATLASKLTMTGTTLGTAGYMAPESLRGQPDAASDVFALGVALHEMLAGELPFAGESPLALMFTIANEPPRAVRALRPDVPEALEQLLARMLEKDPAQRPDAAAAARELASLAGTAPPPLPEPGSAVTGAGASSSMAGGGTPSGVATAVLGSSAASAGAARTGTPGQALARSGGATEELTVERRPSDRALEPAAPAALLVRRKYAIRNRLILAGAVAATLGYVIYSYVSGDHRERHDQAVIFNNMGQIALLRDSVARARDLFGRALERDANFAPAILNLGHLYRREGNLDSAAILFSRVAGHARNNPATAALAEYGLAQIDLQSGALDGAVQHFGKSLALDSTHVEFYNDLGWALATSGHAEDARRVLALGLGRFPQSAPLRKNLALALGGLGQTSDAIQLLDDIVLSTPDYASARGLRAVLLARLGNGAGSRSDWGAYLGLNPDSTERASYARDLAAAPR